MAKANFQPNTKLLASGLNAAINGQQALGALNVIPKINGSAAGIAGSFTGNYVVLFGAVAFLQMRLVFTSIGPSIGGLSVEFAGTGLNAANAGPNQMIGVPGVSGFLNRVPLTAYLQNSSATIFLLKSQHAETVSRYVGNTDMTDSANITLTGYYNMSQA